MGNNNKKNKLAATQFQILGFQMFLKFIHVVNIFNVYRCCGPSSFDFYHCLANVLSALGTCLDK